MTEGFVGVEHIDDAVNSLSGRAGDEVTSSGSNESGMYPRSNHENKPLPNKTNQKSAESNQTNSTEPMSQNFQNQNLDQRARANPEQPQEPKQKICHGQLQQKFPKAQTKTQTKGFLGPQEENSNVPSAREPTTETGPIPVRVSDAAHNVDLGSDTELDSPARMEKKNRNREEENKGDHSGSLSCDLSFS